MEVELYYGNLKKVIYNGYAGNIFGIQHIEIAEEGVYLIKIKDNKYIRLEELLSNKKKKEIFLDFATKNEDYYVDDLVLVNDLIGTKIKSKKL